MPNKKQKKKAVMPWLYKPCSKKDARFQARYRVFARAARHGKTFLTEVVRPGMECFPQWCVRGGNGRGQIRRWRNGRSGATKPQHPKTGHGLADQRRGWLVHLGMGAQPVALQHEGLRLRVF
ncbi:hypothetical protein [Acidovorax temperans]|uniref:hypothetical protein n=1 Tax=Acidovorax temperans TaxID=80878 RepID=UPI00115185E7|nr:hypothetical protein [Acidovorax temperans]